MCFKLIILAVCGESIIQSQQLRQKQEDPNAVFQAPDEGRLV